MWIWWTKNNQNPSILGRYLWLTEEIEQNEKVTLTPKKTGPRSAVGNVSGNRCESDCRSRGREFDPGPVPYFRGDWSWNNFYGHSPPSAESFKKGCCQLQAKVCARSTG